MQLKCIQYTFKKKILNKKIYKLKNLLKKFIKKD